MPTLVNPPTTGPLAAIQRAALRANPCLDLDVDLLAVQHAAACSSATDWTAATGTHISVDAVTGEVQLARTAPAVLFQQQADASVHHFLHDAQDGSEELALDVFPEPSVASGVPFELAELDIQLGLGTFVGKDKFIRVIVAAYDDRWRLVPLGTPIDINTRDIVAVTPGTLTGAVYTIKFRDDFNRHFLFAPGKASTHTGPGRDGAGLARAVNVDASGASTIVAARGLSISVQPVGPGFSAVWIGCASTGVLAGFNPGTFWRSAPDRQMGPYDPTILGYAASDVNHNPDGRLLTGAVPGYGAITAMDGVSTWGIARRPTTDQRKQDPANGWHQPFHRLRALTYQATGSVVAVLDLGAVPVNPVQVRINDRQPVGTSITYTLSGSNTSVSGPWTTLGAVSDGQSLTNATGTYLYRWYQLTASLTAGGGATKYATPTLLAWQMVERVTLSTWRYLTDFDADASVDPVTGQSSVAELKLPMLRAGVRSYRDLATMINSQYAPASIEAHVYARNVATGERYFLNSYRLENRDPQDGVEEMTFTGGLDLLSGVLPPSVESYRYPATAGTQATITSVTGSAGSYTIGVSGTPFIGAGSLAGFRYQGVTGASARLSYPIVSSGTNNFAISTAVSTGVYGTTPAVGDTFEIHSDLRTRGPLTYAAQEFSAIAADLLNVQSGVPSRYRGQLPAVTRTSASDATPRVSGTYTFAPDGVKALDVLAAIGLHCGGAWQWEQGRIGFFDIYGAKDSVVTWDERDYVTLDTPLGMDRRMPSVKAKYGYQPDTQAFASEMQTDDADAIAGVGRSNLFDVFDIPDEVCQWNDALGTEATFLTAQYQGAWKTGVRLWNVKTVLQYPWLRFGQGVTIMTDQYTDRRIAFGSDGVTDIGSPIAGRVAAVGVIVGKNLWGDAFVVAIRGTDAITSAPVNGTGAVAGSTTVPEVPVPTGSVNPSGHVIVNVTGDSATASIKYLVRTDRAPTAAEVRAATATAASSLTNVDSSVVVVPGGRAWIGALAYNAAGDESLLGSVAIGTPGPLSVSIVINAGSSRSAPNLHYFASGGASPLQLAVAYSTTQNAPASAFTNVGAAGTTPAYDDAPTPDDYEAIYAIVRVTDATGAVKYDRYLIPPMFGLLTKTGGVATMKRGALFDDGWRALRATDPLGTQLHVSAVDSGGRTVAGMFHKPTETLGAIADDTGTGGYYKTNQNQRDGGGRAYQGFDGTANLVRQDGTGTVAIATLAGAMGAHPANMIVNGGGQDGVPLSLVPGWSNADAIVVAGTAKFGDRSILFTHPAASDTNISQTFNATAGDVYRFGAWVKGVSIAGAGVGGLIMLSGSFALLDRVGLDTGHSSSGFWGTYPGQGTFDWTYVEITLLATATGPFTAYLSLGHYGAVSGDCYFDGVTLVKLPANVSTGGYRGSQALDGNNRLVDQRRMPMTSVGGARAQLFLSGTQTPANTPLSSSGNVITVAGLDLYVGDSTPLSYSTTTVTGTASSGGTQNWVYLIDATYSGSGTFVAITDPRQLVNNLNRVYIGSIVCYTSGGGGSVYCVAPETSIRLADGREIMASALGVGAVVRTQHEASLVTGDHPITHASTHDAERWRLTLADGRVLIASHNHRVYVWGRGWTRLDALLPGELVMGDPPSMVAEARALDHGPVVQLVVDDAHTYLSNGILSHNQKQV